ncbi:hypothetical protein HDU78_003101 [Chytriomyces hyalinus]|nr:hypothetical protein HDU78_003101 [Chytriomyces hyalinus]
MVSAAYVLLAYSLAVVSATPVPQAAESTNASSEVIAPIDQVGEALTPISESAGQLAAEVPGEGGSGTTRAATSEGGSRSSGLYDPAVLALMPYVMPPAAGGQSSSSSSSSEGGAKGESSSSGASQSSGTSGETKGASGEGGKSTSESGSASSSSSKGEGKAAGEQGGSASSSESGSKEKTSSQNAASESGAMASPSVTGLMAASGASFNAGVSFIVAALTFVMAF